MYKIANTFAAAVAVTLFVALVVTFGAVMIDGDNEIQNASPIGTWNTDAMGGEQVAWVQAGALTKSN